MVDKKTELEDNKRRLPRKSLYGFYPNIFAEAWPSGTQHIVNSEKGAEAVRTEYNRGKAYTEVTHTGRMTTAALGPVHESTASGKTVTVSKNSDTQVYAHERSGVHAGAVREVSEGENKAVADGSLKIINGPVNHLTASGDSTVIGVSASPGGVSIISNDGDSHTQTRGDSVFYRVGNDIKSIRGESYEDVQEGNKSIVVSGNLRLHSDQHLTIISPTKITLQVGSSKIVIDPQKIVIQSPNVYVDASSEDVKLTAVSRVRSKTDAGTIIESENFPPVGRDPPPD